MTLAVALLAHEAGATLDPVWRNLQVAVPETVPLVLIDAGSGDRTAERLAACAAESHAQHIALSEPGCPAGVARGLARRLTGCRRVLLMRPGDRLAPGAVARLAEWLARRDPPRALLAGGWWLAEPHAGAAPLAWPDADRLAVVLAAAGPAPEAETLLALTPDPRRLLPTEAAPEHDPAEHDPFADPGPAWSAWQAALSTPGPVAAFPEPVLLRAVPRANAAAAIAALRAGLEAAPRGARAGLLDRMGPWAGDALALSPAADAPALAAAIDALRAVLPRRLRRHAAALPGPAGAVFRAAEEGALMAALGLLATARQERLTEALAADCARLRADLDLALPGPDYLADLYARVRGL